MAEVRFAPAARRDLEDVFDYTLAEWGLSQALRYVDLIEQACAALAKAPGVSIPCDHIRPGYRRRLVQKHVIYFRLEPYGVAVIRILHGQMEAEHRL